MLNENVASTEIEWLKKFESEFNDLTKKYIVYKNNHLPRKATNKSHVKMERMKFPIFDGQIRLYPRFKFDFEKYVFPDIESDSKAAYILRSCLAGEAKTLVLHIYDDLSKMWARLDEKYGRPGKVADLIMVDVRKHKYLKDGDDKGLLKFVELIECGYRDLERIGMEGEISNLATVSLI